MTEISYNTFPFDDSIKVNFKYLYNQSFSLVKLKTGVKITDSVLLMMLPTCNFCQIAWALL